MELYSTKIEIFFLTALISRSKLTKFPAFNILGT